MKTQNLTFNQYLTSLNVQSFDVKKLTWIFQVDDREGQNF